MATFRIQYKQGHWIVVDPLPNLKDGDEVQIVLRNKKGHQVPLDKSPKSLEGDELEISFLQRKSLKVEELKFDWRGGLRDLRDQYTSVDLQHEIRDLWDQEDVSS